MRPGDLLAASALDWIVGDPESLPHPVRLIGSSITLGERLLYDPRKTPGGNLVAGGLLASGVVIFSYRLTQLLLRAANFLHPTCGRLAEIGLAATCLASRNLYDEARSVLSALESGELPLARTRLARIVGRDTRSLPEHEISRALIETVGESTSDGIVAPLFYLALGGVPLGMAFKAVSTLDSMIGHTSERYLHFGRFAARLDDAANLIPARLSALAIIAVSSVLPQASARSAARTWLEESSHHKSPNAGHPEAAMAGALRVRLGGVNSYAGELIPSPGIGVGFPPPTPASARFALRLMTLASAAAILAGVALAVAAKRRSVTA